MDARRAPTPTTRTRKLDDTELGNQGSRGAARDRRPVQRLIIVLIVLAVLLVVALVGFIVLSQMPVFTITSIDTEDTEHLSAQNIGKLANIEQGTTLLNIDEELIVENLQRNPWVGEVSFVREFPDKLKIVVTERQVGYLVKMSTGSVCWCLGNDDVWIEPVNLTVGEGQSADEAAFALAQDMGVVLITNVPTSMSPTAGSAATDEVIKAIDTYEEVLSQDFLAQIVRFSASSTESLACTLKNGVEVSLGGPSNIELKEDVVTQLLEKHPNQITYINVRVPSQPTYRRIGVDNVAEGSGIVVTPPVAFDELGTGQQGSSGTASGQEGAASDGQGQQDAQTLAADGGQGTAAEDPYAGTSDGSYQDVTTPVSDDSSDLILGDDGNYYTYEQYWGLD